MTEQKKVTLEYVERRLIAEHREPFHNWLRQIITLASGALTLLVGLQSHYIPQHPKGLWLLRLCWGCLAGSVLSGVFSLRSEWQTPLSGAMKLRSIRTTLGEDAAMDYVLANPSIVPDRKFAIATRATFYLFCIAVVSVAIFAVWNLG